MRPGDLSIRRPLDPAPRPCGAVAASPPRVLLFCPAPRSDAGGVQAVMESLEAGLDRCHVPRLRIGPDERETPGTYRLRLAPPVQGQSRLTPRALARGAKSLLRLAAVMARFRPDVVNVHFACTAFDYFLLLRRIFGYRLILSLHGSDLFHPHPDLRPHLPHYLRAADAVTVVSGAMAEHATGIAGPGAEIRILPNGIDTEFWHAGGRVAGHRIVAAGRLVPVKGFDILIEALAQVPDADLDLYGEGPERTALEALARKRGVADRLRLPGRADRETLRRAFRGAAAFAMPSRSEGMPLALMEAMACGTPPVASAVGEIPRIVSPEAGWTVPPEDAGALAAALRTALAQASPERRRAARDRVAPFATAAMVERYLALYAGRPAPAGVAAA